MNYILTTTKNQPISGGMFQEWKDVLTWFSNVPVQDHSSVIIWEVSSPRQMTEWNGIHSNNAKLMVGY